MVATTAMLYGPIPTTVLAAILHTYVVTGRSESRVRLVDIVENWNISPACTHHSHIDNIASDDSILVCHIRWVPFKEDGG